jgi:hypothetical protein
LMCASYFILRVEEVRSPSLILIQIGLEF